LQFNLEYDDFKRLNLNSYIGYGFSDKKMKYELEYSHQLLKDRSLRIDASVFRRLNALFYGLTGIFTGYNTITSLLTKDDYYNYYYSSGYDIRVSKSFIPQVELALRYHQEKQTTANTNTNFSIFKKDRKFRDNPRINDAFQRLVGFSLLLDPNKYKLIDFGDGLVSRYTETQFPELFLGFDYSSKKLNSTYEYRKYFAQVEGENNIANFFNIKYKLGAVIFSGDVPFQSLAYFNSTSSALGKDFSFRTMDYQEYLGDKIYYFNFENNFKNIFWSRVPIINKFSLIGFFNAGKSEISNSNLLLSSSKNFDVTKNVFLEAGFGISGILDFLRVDFAWRLNNRILGKNFRLSILGAF